MKKQKITIRNRSNTDRKEVLSESAFVKRVQALATKMRINQLKIGKLVYDYVQEHKFQDERFKKDDIFGYIAEITDLAKRSIYNYYHYYRLQVEYGSNAILQKLEPSKHYEIARLLDHAKAATFIPQAIQEAVEKNMRTADLEKYIAGLTDKEPRKPKQEKPTAPEPSTSPQIFGKDSEAVLQEAVAALELAARDGTKLALNVNKAEHVSVVLELFSKLVRYLPRLVDMKEGSTLAPIVQGQIKELVELQQKIKQEAVQAEIDGRAA